MARLDSLSSALTLLCPLLLCHALHAQPFTFGSVQTIPVPANSAPNLLRSLDLNGDGNTDIYYASYDAGIWVYLGDGKGGFSRPGIKVTETTNAAPYQTPPVFYDVNGDGLADEVYAYVGYTDPSGNNSWSGIFSVLLGDGKGNFTQTTNLPITDGQSGGGGYLVAGDFNHDGLLDFAFTLTRQDLSAGITTVYLNLGGGRFSAISYSFSARRPDSLAVGDFNGDGHLDLIWGNQLSRTGTKNQFDLYCMYGNGDGSFRAAQPCYTLDGEPEAIASADFNRDGNADLVLSVEPKIAANGIPVSGAQARIVTLYAKAFGEGFYWYSSTMASFGYSMLQIQDLNGDGQPDAYSGNSLFENIGGGIFSTAQGLSGNYQSPVFAPFRRSGVGLPAVFYFDRDTNDRISNIEYQANTSPE